MKSLHVAVVGAGPAGLFAAECLAQKGIIVTLYDRMPSPARKFLLAGRGGLNLTHSEAHAAFLTRYGEAHPLMARALQRFSPIDLRAWAAGLGEETFIGSSGRVFPKSFKASPLLRAWLKRLADQGVTLATRHEFIGFTPEGALRFKTPAGEQTIKADAVLLALGGASWPRLGADGSWAPLLSAAGVTLHPFKPANAGWLVPWSAYVRRFAGTPLKRIAVTCQGETVRGDAMITQSGLEGGPIYALGPVMRRALAASHPIIHLDLRPDLAVAALASKLGAMRQGASMAKRLTQAGLSPAMQAILREAGPLPSDAEALAQRIKMAPLPVTGFAGLERAISSAGGVTLDAFDDRMMLKAQPGLFVAGEMLDWEAPTGGYLLQACFATAALAADGIAAYLHTQR